MATTDAVSAESGAGLGPGSGPSAADAPERPRRPTPPWLRAFNYWSYQYRRTWRSSITTSFLYPVLYLTAMGIGLGTLIDHHVHTVNGVAYLDFIAPGLLASTAMQIGTNESTYPVMGAIKWLRTYFAMLATPLRVGDLLLGHLAWITFRLVLVSTIYLGVMAAFGTIHSPWAVLALPSAVLTGLAFAAPVVAFAARQDNDSGFTSLYRFGLIPLLLFSGTFYPVTQLPLGLRFVAYATPLSHGVSLSRGFALGQLHWASFALDFAYLVALAGIGYLLARVSYRKRLVT